MTETLGPIPGLTDEEMARVEQLARDLAAVSSIDLAEARRRIVASQTPRASLAETLVSEHPELD